MGSKSRAPRTLSRWRRAPRSVRLAVYLLLLFTIVWVLRMPGAGRMASVRLRDAPWFRSKRDGFPELRFAGENPAMRGEAIEDAVVHLNVLQRACMANKDSIVPWDYELQGKKMRKAVFGRIVNETDPVPEILATLRECPDVDVYVPEGLRAYGYCEDAAAYAKFLHSRMLPRWAVMGKWKDPKSKKEVTYHDLCPRTPLIFFNHYWEGVNEDPAWPKDKQIYLMPNIEMYELEAKHYWATDIVLCKTKICYEYLTKWYKDHGNPKKSKVLFTRFTSSDLAGTARRALGTDALEVQDFSTVKFLHTPGHSIQKGTRKILDCWLERRDFPIVDVHLSKTMLEKHLHFAMQGENYTQLLEASPNINLHLGILDTVSFGKLLGEAAFIFCTSVMEGYGHYLNQARAAGALVISVGVPPMDELVTNSTGFVIPSDRWADPKQFLGGQDERPHALRGVEGYIATFGEKDVCRAVDYIINSMTVEDRKRRALLGRQQYLYDTMEFAEQMNNLRALARQLHE